MEVVRIAQGAAKRAQAAFTPDSALARQRRTICHKCPLYRAGNDSCSVCGCNITAKSKLAGEHCPKNKW